VRRCLDDLTYHPPACHPKPRRPALPVATGKQAKAKSNAPSYTKVFGESLVKEATKDPRIVAISAAMPSGTGV